MQEIREISSSSILILPFNKNEKKEELENKIKTYLKTENFTLFDYVERNNKLFILKNDVQNFFYQDQRFAIALIYVYPEIIKFMEKEKKEHRNGLFFSFVKNKLYVFKITDYAIELILQAQNDLSVFISIFNKYKELDYYYFYEDIRILQDNINLVTNILGIDEEQKKKFISLNVDLDEIYSNDKKYNLNFKNLKDLFKKNIEISFFEQNSSNFFIFRFIRDLKNKNIFKEKKYKDLLLKRVIPVFLLGILGFAIWYFFIQEKQPDQPMDIPIINKAPVMTLKDRIKKIREKENVEKFMVYSYLKKHKNIFSNNIEEYSLLKENKDKYLVNALLKIKDNKEFKEFIKRNENSIVDTYKILNNNLVTIKSNINIKDLKKLQFIKDIESTPDFIEYSQYFIPLNTLRIQETDSIKKISDFIYIYNFTGTMQDIYKKILKLFLIKDYYINFKITKLDNHKYMLIAIIYMSPKIYKIIHKRR